MATHLSRRIEDYLKTIYAHTEWQPEPITPSVLAAKLAVAPSSVTEMVKKLAAAGPRRRTCRTARSRLTDAGTRSVRSASCAATA